MKFSYNWLKEFVPKLPKPDKLADLLTIHSFEIEGIERMGEDYVLDVKILPNRIADASGHAGLARDIAAILGKSAVLKIKAVKEGKRNLKDIIKVEVKTRLCHRYALRGIAGVHVKDSPKWLQERLATCGLRPINNIVDAANYVMLETGQPLHAFDAEKIGGKKIVVRQAHSGEEISALDDKTYILDETMMVIADIDTSLALAGIKGGGGAGISAGTHTIVIEAATFDGPSIRATSQKLKLRTDASARFSVGLDPNLAGEALERVTSLIQELAGGDVLKGSLDIYPKRVREKKINLRSSYANSLLGTDLRDTEMAAILKRLGFGVQGKGKMLAVTVPTRRGDVTIEEDIIEEIGRMYGLEHIKPQHPLGELVPAHQNPEHFWAEETKDIFAGLGFREAYNYSFIGPEDIALMRESPSDYFELENPLRPEFAFLRQHLISGLLKNASENIAYEPQVRFFEVGKVYPVRNLARAGVPDGPMGQAISNGVNHKGAVGDLPSNEHNHLGAMIAERGSAGGGSIFFELKGAISAYFEKLGLEVWFEDLPASGQVHYPWGAYHPFRSALVKVMDETLGVLGEVHPMVLADAGIRAQVGIFEADFAKLARAADEEKEFRPISKYPSIVRDIALLVLRDTRVEEVLDVIENTGGELLDDTDLFDIYEGDEIPDGKKSLAFHLIFQAKDRTLTDKEADAMVEKVVKALEENLEWEVRK